MAFRGLGDMTFHTLLVPMNQRLLKKSSKEHNKNWLETTHDMQSTQIPQK